MLNRFKNLSCYEEFEIQCDLAGISKIDILKIIGYKANDYYFFVSNDGIFNWFNFEGHYVKDPGVLKTLNWDCIPHVITKCIIPDSITSIGDYTFSDCDSLKSITITNSVIDIGYHVFYNCTSLKEIIFKGKTLEQVKQMKKYPFGIEDKSIIKCKL